MHEAAEAVGKQVYSLSHHPAESLPAGACLIEAMHACAHEANLAQVVLDAASEAASDAAERAKRKAKRKGAAA